MPAAQLTQQGAGHYSVTGELSFATATQLLQQSHALFAGAADIEIDLAGVTHADSAGLSLLIEWLRQAKLHAAQLRYHALPAQLQALANISEVEGLLSHSA
ncbi:MAG: STAS domain-containing protein [Steroidobacteraceae bacterium]